MQKKVEANVLVTQATVKEALDMLRGAVMIVYPMGLPPHDPIHHEFENTEDLSGKQVGFSGLPSVHLHHEFENTEDLSGKQVWFAISTFASQVRK